jgi:hypothetical protein
MVFHSVIDVEGAFLLRGVWINGFWRRIELIERITIKFE